jgi:hypothetical protein
MGPMVAAVVDHTGPVSQRMEDAKEVSDHRDVEADDHLDANDHDHLDVAVSGHHMDLVYQANDHHDCPVSKEELFKGMCKRNINKHMEHQAKIFKKYQSAGNRNDQSQGTKLAMLKIW